jgi:hypothetical protein
VEFEMNAQALLNFQMQDLRFKFSFTDVELRDIKIKRDHIGLSDDHFGNTFEKILNEHASNFNSQYSEGIHVGDIDPRYKMIGGMIKNSTLTPYVKDGWLYGGYSMQTDINALSE